MKTVKKEFDLSLLEKGVDERKVVEVRGIKERQMRRMEKKDRMR